MIRKIILTLLFFLICGGIPLVLADDEEERPFGVLPDNWEKNIRYNEEEKTGVQPLVQLESIRNDKKKSATDMIKDLLWYNVIPLFKYAFVAVSIFYFTLSLFMISSSFGDEEQISKHKKALLWSMFGFGLISLSSEMALVFDPLSQKEGEIANIDQGQMIAQRFITYMQISAGTIALSAMFYAAFRFITAHGEEEVVEKAKKHFQWGFVGLVIIMLADPIINRVFYPSSGQPGKREVVEFTTQIISVVKFFLTFLAAIAFGVFLVAGFYYLTSFGEEERQNKAKQILTGSLIGLIIILSAFALTAFFIPGNN